MLLMTAWGVQTSEGKLSEHFRFYEKWLQGLTTVVIPGQFFFFSFSPHDQINLYVTFLVLQPNQHYTLRHTFTTNYVVQGWGSFLSIYMFANIQMNPYFFSMMIPILPCVGFQA